MSAGHLQTSRRKGPKLFASEFQEMLAKELTWYFAEAECASGVSSKFESNNGWALWGRTGARAWPAEVGADDRMDAACAAGTIERRLRSMADREAGVLLCAFSPRDWPIELEEELGALTGIVVRLAVVGRRGLPQGKLARHEAEVATWLTRALALKDDDTVARLRDKALALFTRAMGNYAKLRGPGPSVVPPGRSDDASES